MEQWNNVELTSMSKKSYTLNHDYDQKVVNKEINAIDPNPKTITESNLSSLLQPGSDIKPKVQPADVETLVRRLYGISISGMRELIAYDDRNYFIEEDCNIKNPLIVSHWPHGYVLKILNSLDSKKEDFVDAQNELLIYLAKQHLQCPRPIANAIGKYYSVEQLNGNKHVVRLLEYIPGKIFHQVNVTKSLLYQSGEFLAKLDCAMKSFNHKAYDSHKTVWMLQSVPQLRDFLYVLQDHSRKVLIEEIIEAFESNVLSILPTLEHQVIHGDYNEQNIVVAASEDHPDIYRVIGVIDFGDTSKSPLIFEIGIALTYMIMQAKDLASGGLFLAGYAAHKPISASLRKYLKYCVVARLAQSLVMGAYTHSLDPSNEYVLVTQAEGWRMIEELWGDSFSTIDELWETTGHQYLTQSNK